MTNTVSDAHAHLINRSAIRIEAAKLELSKPSALPLVSLASIAVVSLLIVAILHSNISQFYGVPPLFLVLLCGLFAPLFAATAHTFELQRKVNALTELMKSQVDRERAA